MFKLILTIALAGQGGAADFHHFSLGDYATQEECREAGDMAIEIAKSSPVKAAVYDCEQS